MPNLVVSEIRHSEDAAGQSLTARFTFPWHRQDILFRTDAGAINRSAEPFLPVALIPAMRKGWDVELPAAVSPELLDGATAVQRIMTDWYPDFHRVTVAAERGPHVGRVEPRASAAFFSGGVDSFFTLHRHRDEISDLLFVHGFDLPLSWGEHRKRMADNARLVAERLGLRLVEVETNLRELGHRRVSWPNAYFGAGLAAVALLLSPRFRWVYLPASVSRDQLIPMGSHPDLDHHWGNGEVEIVHDGVEANRFEKIQAIAEDPVVAEHLRVCYQPVEQGLNCGVCRKCLWTMLVLEAIGRLEATPAFPSQIDLDALKRYPVTDKHQRDRFELTLSHLEERDARPQLRSALRELLARSTDVPPESRFMRRLRKWRRRASRAVLRRR